MPSDAPLKAILIDVGGPLVDETANYDRGLGIMAEVLTEFLGREISKQDVIDEMGRAIDAWTPTATRSVLWKYVGADIESFRTVYARLVKRYFDDSYEITLMPGVEELLPKLAEKYTLAIAGNQRSLVRIKLEEAGILKYFISKEVSEDLKLAKPDSRFFLAICDRIGVPPENCCMIGDRLDNDIYPANVLGMRTIQIRGGPHAVQVPRIPEDVPDAVIGHMSEVVQVIQTWESGS